MSFLLEMKPFLTIDKLLRDMAPTKHQQNILFGGFWHSFRHMEILRSPVQAHPEKYGLQKYHCCNCLP